MSTLDADLLLVERIELTSRSVVEGALYGLAFILYILCARSLYLQLEDRDRYKQRFSALLYMSLVMALALFGITLDAQDLQTSYVDHADYPGGAYAYSWDVFKHLPIAFVGDVVFILLSLVMSGIQVWRLWIIWRASQYSFFIVALPVLSLLAYLGFLVADMAVVARSELTPHLNELFFYGGLVPPLCISIIVTVLIITRIVVVRRKHVRIMGQTDTTNPYMSIISMLIESFALESVWLAAQMFSLPFSDLVSISISNFFFYTQPFIQLLAYLLVVYRVATGRGWKEDTAEKLTTLQWNRDGLQSTQISTRASIPIIHEEA